MIVFLRCFFAFVLLAMLTVTTWASLQIPLWKTPGSVFSHPWVIATFFDTWFGFITFYCWVAYKETTALSRVGWFVFIMAWGNIAMSLYMLITLFRVPASASMEAVLLRRQA